MEKISPDLYFIELGAILETVRVSANSCLKNGKECGRALTMIETAIEVIKNGEDWNYIIPSAASKLRESLKELKSKIEEKIKV